MKLHISFIKTAVVIACLTAAASLSSAQGIKLAKPTPTQLAFQDLELGVFIHYSIDTYAERGAPHGSTPASAFNPTIGAQVDGEWKTIINGQTIGHKRIDQFALVTATAVRFACTGSLAQPVGVRSLAVFNTGIKIP